jgi:hypothetical protein
MGRATLKEDATVDPIRLIRDKAELHGTCYFVLLPDECRRKTSSPAR